MEMSNKQLKHDALKLIQSLYGENAQFRDGQYEAIEATMTNKRVLVVQKTGWGKSLVYFTCTKLLRQQGRGVTVVVSPLLVLMQNQVEAAEKLGLKCDVLNSTVRDRRADIIQALIEDKLDLILITPETLFSDDVQKNLSNIKIGLFVIDEAHCISDWGHDFRLKYCQLRKIIPMLPDNVPILATTATANDRVIADLEKQLGGDVHISRGPLTRESLIIQVLHLHSKAERYAWIIDNIDRLPGHGIIYCLTRRDCDYLADFLKRNGIDAISYHANTDEEVNAEAIKLFSENKVKAIVSTVKLGMGYDKGDIEFVIHFQMPSNIVSYYQQIGRAGRNVPQAYAILMCGREDDDITSYFINTAFPTEEEATQTVDLIANHDGLNLGHIESQLNFRRNRIEKALMFLENEGFIRKDRGKYYITPLKFVYDRDHYQEITNIRKYESTQMKQYAHTKQCYSQFVVNILGDKTAQPCGHCANCLGKEILPSQVASSAIEKAQIYINELIMEIKPRKRWPHKDIEDSSVIKYVNQTGICLSKYGDVGYGELVKRDKYSGQNRFCDELVGKSAQVLKPFIKEHNITHITCVPSLRSNIVRDFAERLAASCGIPFVNHLQKSSARQQKYMQNSAHQCANAFNSFTVIDGVSPPTKMLLVDDIVDSGWTLAVCGYKLMEKGAEEIYPFALADSSEENKDE